jgi:S-DNA-T family DNA segregation ATPase FtsK/SpoIIIE
MANKKNEKKENRQLEDLANNKIKMSILALAIFVLGLICLLSLFSLSGSFGVFLNKYLSLGFGWAKWFFPFLLIFFSIALYKGNLFFTKKTNYIGLFLFFISWPLLFHFFFDSEVIKEKAVAGLGGGYLGLYLSIFIKNIFGFWGGLLIILTLFLLAVILLFGITLSDIIGSKSYFNKIIVWFSNLLRRKEMEEEDFNLENEAEELIDEEGDEEDEEDEVELKENKKNINKSGESEDEIFFSKKEIGAINDKKEKKQEELKINWKTKKVKIDLPLDLLSSEIGKATSGDIKNNILIIQRTLENFGISVAMGEVNVGPTVTQYTFKPSEGVKLSKITTLSNDLSLALAAHPIRIEAPIPGKSLVGIEVPNKSKAIVGLREILEDRDFKVRSSNLMAALGKDVSGKNIVYDIAKMPHLLVAGATNSGKSVCLNAIIVGLLYQNNPEDLRFIMVDPKRVELPAYNNIPHLLTPVITEVNKTVNALRWCLNEMDRRYEILNQAGKKNIQSYNESSKEKMPFIVFVIDELADLMISAAKDIESSVIRLTQMSRAVGIHLILATQRPSVDVITGLIKANTPSRIAFSVASVVDSKTILDSSGAEKLLGKGDMLFSTAELSKPRRIQGAYLSDAEIISIVTYIKEKYGQADYLEGIVDRQKVNGVAGVGLDGNFGDEDDLLEEAKEVVLAAGKASTSLLQRRLRIGYSRAASILDMLEEAGMIGPSNGSKPREILVSGEQMLASSSNSISAMPLHNRSESKAPGSYFYQEEESPLVLDENLSEEESLVDQNSEIEDDDEELVNDEEDNEIKSDAKIEDNHKKNDKEKSQVSKKIDDDFGKYFSK